MDEDEVLEQKKVRALIKDNKRTRVALCATPEQGKYTPVVAADLARLVNDKYRVLSDPSEAKRRRLCKQSVYAGKLFDYYDTSVELVHHMQWKHPSHASYFTPKNKNYGANGANTAVSKTSAPGAPTSAEHVFAQTSLAKTIDRGRPIQFLLKCSRSLHLVLVFQTLPGMTAKTEVFVPGIQRRFLDVAVYATDGSIAFNVEILNCSSTPEGRRDGSWVEINAMHVLDQLEMGGTATCQMICEPRCDMKMRCHFLEPPECYECTHCVEETASTCIAIAYRRRFDRLQRRCKTASTCIAIAYRRRFVRLQRRRKRIRELRAEFYRRLECLLHSVRRRDKLKAEFLKRLSVRRLERLQRQLHGVKEVQPTPGFRHKVSATWDH